MNGISVAKEGRVFQTKEIARTKSHKHKRAQNVLSFGKQSSLGIEAQHMEKAKELEKTIGKRVWAMSNMEYVNSRILLREGLHGCVLRAEPGLILRSSPPFPSPKISQFRHYHHFGIDHTLPWELTSVVEVFISTFGP